MQNKPDFFLQDREPSETTEKVEIAVALRVILWYNRSIKIRKGVFGCFEQETVSK